MRIVYLAALVVCFLESTSPAEGANAIICQGQSQTISCPDGQIVAVHSSFYGRNDATTCVHAFVPAPSNCFADGANRRIIALCDCQPSCTLSASQSIFGNPCQISNEFVSLQYTCESSQFCLLPTTSRTALSASSLTTLTSSPTTTTLPKAMTLPTTTSSSELTTSMTSNSQPQATSTVKTNLEISTTLTAESLTTSMITDSTKRRENQTTSESSPNTKISVTAFMTKFSRLYTSAATTLHSESNGVKLSGINILWIAVPVGVVAAIVFIVTCALVYLRKTKKKPWRPTSSSKDSQESSLKPMVQLTQRSRIENVNVNGEFQLLDDGICEKIFTCSPEIIVNNLSAVHAGGGGQMEESAPSSTFTVLADSSRAYEVVNDLANTNNHDDYEIPNRSDNDYEKTLYDEI